MKNKTLLIRNQAYELGFDYIGFSKAAFLASEAPHLEAWLKNNLHGKMQYMENNFDKRLDPTKLVEGAKTVVLLLYNYHTNQKQNDPEAPHISKYAYGKDYHYVVKEKLACLLQYIRHIFGDVQGRAFVDSAPVLERAWAKKSGAGWIGKNSMLINPKKGSYFFLAELIIDLELDEYDGPIKDYCGKCTRCIDACPTQAIVDNKIIDANKCISYLTIELKDAIPIEFSNKMGNWMFGCDICQDVCPWNRFAKPNSEPQFSPSDELLNKSKREWLEITHDVFTKLFKNSAVKRTGFAGLKRNLAFLKNDF